MNIDLTEKEIRVLVDVITPLYIRFDVPSECRALTAKLEGALEALAKERQLTDDELEVIRAYRLQRAEVAKPAVPKVGDRVRIVGEYLLPDVPLPGNVGQLTAIDCQKEWRYLVTNGSRSNLARIVEPA